MSLINRMLQELDRRHAMATPEGGLPPRHVRAVQKVQGGHEWFWRILALILVLAVGWVLWVTYQLQPRPIVTDQAFKAAERAEQRVLLTPESVPATPQVSPLLQSQGLLAQPTEAPMASPVESLRAATPESPRMAAQPAVVAAAPESGLKASPQETTKPPSVAPESLRLALSIETPIPDRPRATTAREPSRVQRTEPAPPLTSDPPASPALVQARTESSKTRPQVTPDAMPGRVEKRDRVRTSAERAEADFRRGVALLNQGRGSEAEDAFNAALANNVSNRPARQALIALLLEQQRLDDARKRLQEGLAIDPTYMPYSLVLARIFVERGDLPASLGVLNAAKDSARGNSEYSALLGNIQQRLANHREAADAYREALRLAPEAGPAWVGLALSLEALEHRPEAAEAFRRAVATGTLTADLRVFAEQRARLLQP